MAKTLQQMLECAGLPSCDKEWKRCKNCTIRVSEKDKGILPEDEKERGVPITEFLNVSVAISIPDPKEFECEIPMDLNIRFPGENGFFPWDGALA